jgi:hypothetical protein
VSAAGTRWCCSACLASGFTVAAATDMFGAGEAFVIVAFVLGSLCAATLVQVVLDQKGPTI